MTVEHLDGFAPYTGKEVLQFSPNYTVFALPSDTLCLYSEDRKFLLNGKLYCAIADAIAAGGKSLAGLVRELERDFPADQVREALRRLIERRHLVAKFTAFGGAVAAYWASMGLPLDTAEKNLEDCRIRIQAIDVDGEQELGAALAELGVRTAKRSADLTVVLVNDYLDVQLADLNKRHLADGTPWVLAQPSGIFPLACPSSRPGEGACWVCLGDRMIRNREVRAMLGRTDSRRLTVSPLVQNAVGQAGIQLAAVEIARAIATGFRTDLGRPS